MIHLCAKIRQVPLSISFDAMFGFSLIIRSHMLLNDVALNAYIGYILFILHSSTN